MKYCPLTWLSTESFTDEECEREECAWWDDKRKQCSIKTFLTNGEIPSVTIKEEPNDIDHYFL